MGNCDSMSAQHQGQGMNERNGIGRNLLEGSFQCVDIYVAEHEHRIVLLSVAGMSTEYQIEMLSKAFPLPEKLRIYRNTKTP